MRVLVSAIAATFLLLPAAAPANACGAAANTAKAAIDYSAKKKKPLKVAKAKKEKVEYMRAAPLPPGSK